jgi:hypothetical protein
MAAAPTPLLDEDEITMNPQSPSPIAVQAPPLWTAPRIANIAALIFIPLIVVSIRPNASIIGLAAVFEVALTALAVKLCVIE